MPNLAATRAPCPRPCFPVTCCLWSQFTLRKSKSHLLSPGKSGNGKGMALEQRSWECAVVCSFPEEHQVHICQYFKMLALLEPKLPLHRSSQRQAHLYPTVHPQSPPRPPGYTWVPRCLLLPGLWGLPRPLTATAILPGTLWPVLPTPKACFL